MSVSHLICPFIMMDNWVVFTLGLSCFHKDLCTSFTWKCRNLAFNFLGYISRSKIAGLYYYSILNFWEIANVSKATEPFYISISNTRLRLLHILITCYCHSFVITTIPVGVKRYVIVVFICISLLVNLGRSFWEPQEGKPGARALEIFFKSLNKW